MWALIITTCYHAGSREGGAHSHTHTIEGFRSEDLCRQAKNVYIKESLYKTNLGVVVACIQIN